MLSVAEIHQASRCAHVGAADTGAVFSMGAARGTGVTAKVCFYLSFLFHFIYSEFYFIFFFYFYFYFYFCGFFFCFSFFICSSSSFLFIFPF
jgi:hypothetical protein